MERRGGSLNKKSRMETMAWWNAERRGGASLNKELELGPWFGGRQGGKFK